MKIHSNTLDALEVRKAARIAGVDFTRFALVGSRSHAAGFDFTLTGSSSRHQNGGPDKAATWDEWGHLLGLLFTVDPTMVCGTVKRPIYANAEHFHFVTANRFQDLDNASFVRGHNHKWEFSGHAVTGAYSVHECVKCGAVQRFTRDWALVS